MARLLHAICLLAAAAAAQTPAGSIAGQVVDARSGAPLKRAIVHLAGGVGQAPANPNALSAGRPLMINAETDEQGRYLFTGLAPGKYRITVERQGFLRQSFGARKYSGGSTPVAVGEGQAVKAIDFRLAPQAVITGSVLDEDGEPMANVQVRAERSYMRSGRRQWVTAANAVTSDIGRYRLPALSPGRYVVVATPPSIYLGTVISGPRQPLPQKPDTVYTSTFYPSTRDAATAVPVDVAEGDEVRDIDIRLVKSNVFRVRGRVTGLPEIAAARRGGFVRVNLIPRDPAPSTGTALAGMARPPDGVFEIRNVPAGQYLAQAQGLGPAPQYAAAANVDVLGNNIDGLTLHLSPGGDVPGSIKIVDADSPPSLANLRVMLRPVVFGPVAAQAQPGAGREFTLKNVPPLPYTVAVTGVPDGFYVKSIQYGGADIPANGVTLTGGGTIAVTLSGAAARVDIVVTTADSKVAPDAQIAVLKDGAPDSVHTTDENGMLTLSSLAPGSYRLIAWEDIDPERLSDPDFLARFPNDGKSLKLDPSAHEAVQLTALPAQ